MELKRNRKLRIHPPRRTEVVLGKWLELNRGLQLSGIPQDGLAEIFKYYHLPMRCRLQQLGDTIDLVISDCGLDFIAQIFRSLFNQLKDGQTSPFSTAYIVQEPRAVVVGEIPPAFADLNKSIEDLFTKNYHIGFGKIDVRTVTANGVEIRGIGQQDIAGDAPRAFGSLEHKYVQRDYGLTLIEKWSTDNMVTMEASVEDKFLAGAKVTFLAGLSAQTGKRNAGLKFAYRRPFLHVTTDVDLDFAGPVVRSSAVSAYNNLRFGGSLVFDSAKSAITRYNLALGLGASWYTLHAGTTHFRDFEMGVYNGVDQNLEVGFQSNFSTKFPMGISEAQ